MNRRGASILTALEFFRQAIAADPNYALAYAGYADASNYLAGYNFRPGIEVMNDIKQAAETAVRLDDSLGEAYCALVPVLKSIFFPLN